MQIFPEAYQKGFLDRIENKSLQDNPYRKLNHPEQWIQWRYGWEAANKEIRYTN